MPPLIVVAPVYVFATPNWSGLLPTWIMVSEPVPLIAPEITAVPVEAVAAATLNVWLLSALLAIFPAQMPCVACKVPPFAFT